MRTLAEQQQRDLKDRALLRRMRAGDRLAEDELLKHYMPIVRMIASNYFYPGADHNDPIQEGLYGLTLAMRGFDLDHGAPFASFVDLVVRRHIITGLKAAQRGKHSFITNSLRSALSEDGDPMDITDLIPSRRGDPHASLMESEQIAKLVEGVKKLSKLERDSILGIVSGVPYATLVEEVGGDCKRVDNAAQRARRRLRAIPELEAA